MAEVYDVRHGKDESPGMYLKRLIGAFKQYSPSDLESGKAQQAVILAYVNEVAPDIKRNLQSLERLGERSIRDSSSCGTGLQ